MYCLAELTEFAAFIALRIKAPDLKRPYRIPLPTWGCVLMLLPASVLLLVILALPIIQGDWQVGFQFVMALPALQCSFPSRFGSAGLEGDLCGNLFYKVSRFKRHF